MGKCRINRIEAKYAAYSYGFSWVSECAEKGYDSDFYDEIRSVNMLDESKLDETNGFDDKLQLFIPNDEEVALIKSEMMKLSNKLFKVMMECKEKYKKPDL